MNYEFNLLHHVGVVAKRLCAAAETALKRDDNTLSGPTGRGVKMAETDVQVTEHGPKPFTSDSPNITFPSKGNQIKSKIR